MTAVSINKQAVLNLVINTTLAGNTYQNTQTMAIPIIGGQGNNVNKFSNSGFLASTINQKVIPSSSTFTYILPDKVIANSSTLLVNVYGSNFAIWQEAQN
jgi:hypothetical protein